MPTNNRFLLIVPALVCLLTLAPAAATPSAVTIRGTVTDGAGSPVSHAVIQAFTAEGDLLRELQTNADGRFTFVVPPGPMLFLRARTAGRVSTEARVDTFGRSVAVVDLEVGVGRESGERNVSSANSSPSPTELQGILREMEALQARLTALQQQVDRLTGTPALPTASLPMGASAADIEHVSPQTADSFSEPIAATKPPEPGQEPAGQSLYPEPKDPRGVSLGEKVVVGGYGSFRYEANSISPATRIGSLPAARRSFDSFDFRRFVLTLDATPTNRLRFYTEIEFERLGKIEVERTALPENRGTRDRAGVRFIQEVEGLDGSELAMEQAWAQYDFSQALSARMGVILPPVGRFNINHDDDAWDIPRRSLVDRGGPVLPVKSAWSELGAGVLGNVPVGDGFLDYQFFVVNGAQLDFTLEEVVSLREGRNLVEFEPEIAFASGPFNGTNTADALTWRFAYTPRLGHEIALSGYHGEYTPPYLNANSWIHSVAVDGKTTLGLLEVEGEFVYSDFGRLERVLNDIALQAVDAAAATSSAETTTLETEVEAEFAGPLTNQRYGFWVDFKTRFWPESLNNTFLGHDFEDPQLIPIFRLERIWFNDLVRTFDFSGGAITDLQTETLSQLRSTLGLTYRPAPTVGFTVGWEYNRRMEGSTLIFPRTLGLGEVPNKTYNSLIVGTVFGF